MSNTLDIDFCPRALERTYEITIPDIMNSDQGQSLNDKTPTEVYFGQNKKPSSSSSLQIYILIQISSRLNQLFHGSKTV